MTDDDVLDLDDLPDHVVEATPDVLLGREAPRMLLLRYEERYLSIDFERRECADCGRETEHRVVTDRYREVENASSSCCGAERERDLDD